MKAKIIIAREFTIGNVDERIYGGFVEHIGRCVYDGIYEPDHPDADPDGFRNDVASLVRGLHMPVTRYPGGNFVSGFDWHDTIGDKSTRPVRLDYAWNALEPNQIGIDEFVKWCRKVQTVPMICVNLGTGTAKSAQELVGYCNFPGGSYWSDLRRRNGAEKPYGIKMWCLGNEMDGPWQIGHKTASEYARLAHEAGKMMKMADPSIELTVCGSSSLYMNTFAEWDEAVLSETFDIADFIALHAYYNCRDGNRPAFLASPELLDRQIRGIVAVCDFVAAKKQSPRVIQLSLDEWNVWYRGNAQAHPETLWQTARPILEEIYDMADVLVVGGLLLTMLDHADRLKVACLAQSVNIVAPIMTRKGGGAWRQTIYYPFSYTSKYGRGTVLRLRLDSPGYEVKNQPNPVSYLKAAAVLSPDGAELRIFAINRSLHTPMTLELAETGFALKSMNEAVEIANPDLDAVNTEEREDVFPEVIAPERFTLNGNGFSAELKPASWNCFRIALSDPKVGVDKSC